MTAVNIGQRFGVLDIEENGQVSNFREKQESDGGVINGGYMVLEPQVFDYIEGDETVFENSRWKSLLRMDSWWLIDMTDFGNVWIHREIKFN